MRRASLLHLSSVPTEVQTMVEDLPFESQKCFLSAQTILCIPLKTPDLYLDLSEFTYQRRRDAQECISSPHDPDDNSALFQGTMTPSTEDKGLLPNVDSPLFKRLSLMHSPRSNNFEDLVEALRSLPLFQLSPPSSFHQFGYRLAPFSPSLR